MKDDKLTGKLKFEYNAVIESIDKATGDVIKRIKIHNLIVNDGLNLIRNWMYGDSVNNPTAIAVGTDATAPANTDSTLGSEVTREIASKSKPSDYQVKYEKVFSVGSGESYAIKEIGLFDSDTVSGSMLFSRIAADNTLDADTDLSVKITYTISRS